MATSEKNSPEEVKLRYTVTLADLKDCPVKEDTPNKRIVFLGDAGIGKTTFIKKHCERIGSYNILFGYAGSVLTITEFILHIQQEEECYFIRLFDFPAGTTEDSRKGEYQAEVDLIVFCFAIDQPVSLDNVWKKWLPESRKCFPEFGRFYLQGLRQDMRQEVLEESEMPVTLERGKEFHEKYKFRGEYMECSVLKNPADAFNLMETLISEVLRCKPTPAAV